MALDQWVEVDRYVTDLLVQPDPVLDAVLRASAEAGLPAISVSAPQGKLLHLLARSIGARAILEIGTLGGYSTVWLAQALPSGGRLVSLETDPKHAGVARSNIARAGLDGLVDVRVGRAQDILPQLVAEGSGPFDLVFIDADKSSTPDYYTWAVRLARRGSLIVVDNVIRNGAVADPSGTDPSVLGIRRFNELVAADPRASATAVQTVGEKGYDGFAVVLVTADP